MRGGRENLRYPADTALAERDTSRPLVSTTNTIDTIAACHLAASGDWLGLCFTGLSNVRRSCCAFSFAL